MASVLLTLWMVPPQSSISQWRDSDRCFLGMKCSSTCVAGIVYTITIQRLVHNTTDSVTHTDTDTWTHATHTSHTFVHTCTHFCGLSPSHHCIQLHAYMLIWMCEVLSTSDSLTVALSRLIRMLQVCQLQCGFHVFIRISEGIWHFDHKGLLHLCWNLQRTFVIKCLSVCFMITERVSATFNIVHSLSLYHIICTCVAFSVFLSVFPLLVSSHPWSDCPCCGELCWWLGGRHGSGQSRQACHGSGLLLWVSTAKRCSWAWHCVDGEGRPCTQHAFSRVVNSRVWMLRGAGDADIVQRVIYRLIFDCLCHALLLQWSHQDCHEVPLISMLR